MLSLLPDQTSVISICGLRVLRIDDTGTHYYPSEGILTISGSRSGSYNIEFYGVTSSGIKLIASYKGKMDILPQ